MAEHEPELNLEPEKEMAHLRMVEALLFAASEPLDVPSIAARLPEGANVPRLLEILQSHYEGRGVQLSQAGELWHFHTAADLRPILNIEKTESKKLSRAALETLSIIAYHQPATRTEIEEIRGVALSKGTLDVLLEANWVSPKGRRQSPGRPMTYGTTDEFLVHFGLASLGDLPGLEELRAAGLLDGQPELPTIGRAPGTYGSEKLPRPADHVEEELPEPLLMDGDGA